MLSIVRAQVSRAGIGLLAVPVAGGLVGVLAGWLTALAWSNFQTMTLVSWLEQLYVICVGVTSAVVLTDDPLIELHEASPTSFRTVQFSRAALIAVSGIIGACVLFIPLHLLRVWPNDQGWGTVLAPIGAVVVIVSVAVATAASSQTASATTIAVVATWIFLALLWDPYVPKDFLVRRGIPLLGAIVLIISAWWRLGNTERNIAKVAQP